jgi:hypothetical protein
MDNLMANTIPKGVVTLEKLFDLKDKFKKSSNVKTHSSTLGHEMINLGTIENPKNVNLGTCCTEEEKHAYLKLF